MNHTLVAGIGNIFMGDDGFGSEVARRLLGQAIPDGVDVVDFGIRGIDLGYALTDGYALAILIDTADRGGAPGTLRVIEPTFADATTTATHGVEPLLTPHAMDPARVLNYIAALGEHRPRVLLVACQPQTLGGEDGHMGLSPAVEAAVDRAVAEVLLLIRDRAPSQEDEAIGLQEA